MTDLTALVSQISAAHTELTHAVRHTLTRAKALGELLDTAKKSFKRRGQFNEWVEANFPFGSRTATNYMVVARDWDKFEADNLVNLTLPEFLASVRNGKKTGKKNDEATGKDKVTRKPKAGGLTLKAAIVLEAAGRLGVQGDVLALLEELGVPVDKVELMAA
ncbi:hypothetical protein [Gemmata sp.]|uniref:hypothetical protein n=1 Tax=Gemmata sp. TaxID=1914242 RepID=UPI003F70C406